MRIVEVSELREQAVRYFADARRELTESKNLTPFFVLLSPIDDERGAEFIAVDGEIMNSDNQKQALADMVREHIRGGGYTATLFISDVWQLSLKPEQMPSFRFFQKLGLSHPEIAKMGIGEIQEEILATIETIDGKTLVIRQPYTRQEDGTVTGFGDIEDGGKMAQCRFRLFEGSETSARSGTE